MNRRILLLILLLSTTFYVYAGVLQAKVTAIRDGRTLVVFTGGHQVVVVLQGADVPDEKQPFAAVARQHLSDLILDRVVTVEYSAYGAQGALIARVSCQGVDIGQQMIRDGAARYNPDFDADLNPQEKQLYLQSEAAARSEQRGVWLPAWNLADTDWRHLRPAKTAPAVVEVPRTTLTATQPMASHATVNRSGKEIVWPMLKPENAPFSLRMPAGGKSFSKDLNFQDGRTASTNMYMVMHPGIQYLAFWGDGPLLTQSVTRDWEEYLTTLQDLLQANGYPCEFTRLKPVTINNFSGTQYNVRNCALHGGMRLFHKVNGNRLTVYLFTALSDEADNPQVDRFLNSVTLD